MIKRLKIKTAGLTVLGLVIVMCFSVQSASACRIICFSGNCYEFEGSCPASCDNCQCYDVLAMNNPPPTDLIVALNGYAQTYRGGKINDIAGDKLAAFVMKMERKYPQGKDINLKNQKQRAVEYDAFFKKYNKKTDTIGKSRLALIARESKLKVVAKLPVAVMGTAR